MLIWLNSVDWVCFELLNLGNPAITSIPTGPRILDGLFQALGKLLTLLSLKINQHSNRPLIAVRSGGFYVVPISQAYIGLQILYVIMMYISVYPVVITIRHSNVYEERSLGIYSGDTPSPDDSDPELAVPQRSQDGPNFESASRHSNKVLSLASPVMRRLSRSTAAADIGHALQRTFTLNGVGVPPIKQGINKPGVFPAFGHLNGNNNPNSRISFISQQIHGQLAHDIWWLVLAVLIIATIETSHFMEDPVTYSVFNIIFEVVSAYGSVGISVGIPTDAYSFSGAWYTGSKLVLCLVMLRGRHRALPVALDHAVRLPGEHLHRDEEEDHRIRRSMTTRRADLDS